MFDLEEHVAFYAHEGFTPGAEAQRLFASLSENEIKPKLNEMADIQRDIEEILKKKVREKYSLFLDTNREINDVGAKVASLKDIAANTEDIITRLRNGAQIFADLPKAKKQSNTYVQHSLPSAPRSGVIATATTNPSRPAWVVGIVGTIERFIVEKQYLQATKAILQFRAYSNKNAYHTGSSNDNSSSNNNANRKNSASSYSSIASDVEWTELNRRVNDKTNALTSALKQSLSRLPHSQVWGAKEYSRRVGLLIALGRFETAAKGFCENEDEVVKKVLLDLTAGMPGSAASSDASTQAVAQLLAAGNNLSIKTRVTLLSSRFFSALLASCDKFHVLFSSSLTTATASTGLVSTVQRSSHDALSELLFSESPAPTYQKHFSSSSSVASSSGSKSASSSGEAVTGTSHPNIEVNMALALVAMSDADKIAVSIILYDWINRQLREFAGVAASLIRVGVYDSTIALLLHLRGGSFLPPCLSRLVNIITNTNHTPPSSIGPLTFLGTCLEDIISHAGRLDSLQYLVRPRMGLVLSKSIQGSVKLMADEIIRELTTQVHQETWQRGIGDVITTELYRTAKSVTANNINGGNSNIELEEGRLQSLYLSCVVLVPPLSLYHTIDTGDSMVAAATKRKPVHNDVAASLLWLTAALNTFFDESYRLLGLDDNNNNNNNNRAGYGDDNSTSSGGGGSFRAGRGIAKNAISFSLPGYLHSDICEAVPIVISSALRILVRFALLLEQTTKRFMEDSASVGGESFDADCIVNTIQVLGTRTVSSVEAVISSSFADIQLLGDDYDEDYDADENDRPLIAHDHLLLTARLKGRIQALWQEANKVL